MGEGEAGEGLGVRRRRRRGAEPLQVDVEGRGVVEGQDPVPLAAGHEHRVADPPPAVADAEFDVVLYLEVERTWRAPAVLFDVLYLVLAGGDGLDHLQQAVMGFSGSPDELCDRVTEAMVDDEPTDDVCLLAVRLTGPPVGG